jgi:hypothetical protein
MSLVLLVVCYVFYECGGKEVESGNQCLYRKLENSMMAPPTLSLERQDYAIFPNNAGAVTTLTLELKVLRSNLAWVNIFLTFNDLLFLLACKYMLFDASID